jgi:DNA-binding CsgD family transcriptional regulator/PAS domain-containing protein
MPPARDTLIVNSLASNDTFVAAVEAIYDAAPEPSRWPNALQAIADVFGDVGAVLIYGRDDESFGAIASPTLGPLMQEYVREFGGQDLRAIRARERYFLGRDASTDRDMVSAEEMETHPYYRFLARHGLKYFAAAPVSPDPRINAAISIQRSIDKAPYSGGELEIVERLCRYAEKALRLSIRLLDAEVAKVGLSEALSRLSIGVFALDSIGRVTFSNPAGERLLGDGLDLREGRLRIGQTPAHSEIEAAIALCLGGEPEALIAEPKPLLIERSRSLRALAVYVLSVRNAVNPAHAFLTHTRAIVLVVDPEAGGPADPAMVRDLLGLTLGEARVASLVGSGMAPRGAAEKLGITEETARTTLKHVFAKVGVSRQSELTALLTRLTLG